MEITKAVFKKSSGSIQDAPDDQKPEFIFIGRSNVGKSSLINMLAHHKGLAKVSATPGKTISINHFLINDSWYLVDLPGYGYARRSKEKRAEWERVMFEYFEKRDTIMCVFVLVDSRIPPQQSDLNFIYRLGEMGIPICILFTKTDQSRASETVRNIAAFNKKMLESWEELPDSIQTSSVTKKGREDILNYVATALKQLK